MVSPAVEITAYEIEDLSLHPVRGYIPDQPVVASIGFQFNFAVEAERIFGARLKVQLTREGVDDDKVNLAYETDVTIRGWFETPIVLKQKLVPAPFANNAVAILYGTTRGFIAQTTSMFQNGPMILPAVVFDDMIAEAANSPSSVVTPVDLPLKAPGAVEAIGFSLAIQDLPRVVAAVSDGALRDELSALARDLVRVVESAPGPHNASEMADLVDRLRRAAERTDAPIRDLLRTLMQRVATGIRRLDAIAAALTPHKDS